MAITEFLAASTTLICVYLGVRANIWNFIFGIISVTLYMIIFYQVRLYADMTLQIVYLILQFTGWYEWLYGNKNRTPLKIRHTSLKMVIVCIVAVLLLFYGYHLVLKNYTNSNTTYIDAFVTALSLVGQLMMNRKWVEGWLFFAVADAISINMYFFKQLYWTTGLFIILTVLALMGYVHWRKRCYDR